MNRALSICALALAAWLLASPALAQEAPKKGGGAQAGPEPFRSDSTAMERYRPETNCHRRRRAGRQIRLQTESRFTELGRATVACVGVRVFLYRLGTEAKGGGRRRPADR